MTKTAPCIIATSSSCCFCVGCWTQDFLYWREFMCSVTALCVIRCRRSKRARTFNGPFSGTTVGSAARRYQSIAAQLAGLSAVNAGSVMSAGIGCWTRDFLYWREFMCSVTALCVSRCLRSKRAHAFNGPRSRQPPSTHPTTQFSTGWMPFLPPSQQRRSTEGMTGNTGNH